MANTKSAAKRARQTKTRTLRNRRVLTGLKTKTKVFAAGAAAGDATTAYRDLVSELDRAAKRGIIHRNVANRRKSRLARAIAAKKTA